jgi:hypothetical protein
MFRERARQPRILADADAQNPAVRRDPVDLGGAGATQECAAAGGNATPHLRWSALSARENGRADA